MNYGGVGCDDIINSSITLFHSSPSIPLASLTLARALNPPNRPHCRYPSYRTPSLVLPCCSSSEAPLFPIWSHSYRYFELIKLLCLGKCGSIGLVDQSQVHPDFQQLLQHFLALSYNCVICMIRPIRRGVLPVLFCLFTRSDSWADVSFFAARGKR